MTIELEPRGKIEDLDATAATIMLSLSGTKYFSVIDDTKSSSRTRTLFVVSLDREASTLEEKKREARILEEKICEVIGGALKGKKSISFDLCFRRRK